MSTKRKGRPAKQARQKRALRRFEAEFANPKSAWRRDNAFNNLCALRAKGVGE